MPLVLPFGVAGNAQRQERHVDSWASQLLRSVVVILPAQRGMINLPGGQRVQEVLTPRVIGRGAMAAAL